MRTRTLLLPCGCKVTAYPDTDLALWNSQCKIHASCKPSNTITQVKDNKPPYVDCRALEKVSGNYA